MIAQAHITNKKAANEGLRTEEEALQLKTACARKLLQQGCAPLHGGVDWPDSTLSLSSVSFWLLRRPSTVITQNCSTKIYRDVVLGFVYFLPSISEFSMDRGQRRRCFCWSFDKFLTHSSQSKRRVLEWRHIGWSGVGQLSYEVHRARKGDLWRLWKAKQHSEMLSCLEYFS